jgi:hypothetical protein
VRGAELEAFVERRWVMVAPSMSSSHLTERALFIAEVSAWLATRGYGKVEARQAAVCLWFYTMPAVSFQK